MTRSRGGGLPADPLGEVRVRAGNADDVPAVVALVESAYRGEASRAGWTTEAGLLDGQRTDAEAVRRAIASPGNEILLAEAGGRPVGCCHLRSEPAGGAHFGMFAVTPGLQGRGLGRLLIGEAERRAAARGAPWMSMEVITQRRELLDWYLRLGYRPTGERRPFPYGDERFGLPRRDDLDFTVLEKPLAAPAPPRSAARLARRGPPGRK